MSPLEIQIMLNCYCSHSPWDNVLPRIWNSSASRRAQSKLVDDGLLDEHLRPTRIGELYVEALMAVDPRFAYAAEGLLTADKLTSVSRL